MLIVIGYMTDTSVIQLFLAGIVPGLLIGVGLMVVAYIHALKGGAAYAPSTREFSLQRTLKKGIQALPGLGLPFIIVFGILGGIFTVTEAAVVAVVYGFIVAKYIYRELDVAEMPRILFKSAKFATAIILINATAFIFSWVITAHQLPMTITSFVTSTVDSRIEFCLYLGIIVLIIGMFMETFSATIIFAPLLLPIATEFGIDPVHFGMILMVGWAIGYVTPPFGVNLFVSCSITGVSIREATAYVVPMVVSMLVVFAAVMFFPQIFAWLPNMAR
jgi:C4-dicarboxylate transporter DctM subunit